jgi:hypothetical protein
MGEESPASAAALTTGTAAVAATDAATTGAAASSSAFQIGETVSVKGYGNAVVVAGPVEEPGQFHGRYQVRYPDGKLYHAKPSKLRRFEKVGSSGWRTTSDYEHPFGR